PVRSDALTRCGPTLEPLANRTRVGRHARAVTAPGGECGGALQKARAGLVYGPALEHPWRASPDQARWVSGGTFASASCSGSLPRGSLRHPWLPRASDAPPETHRAWSGEPACEAAPWQFPISGFGVGAPSSLVGGACTRGRALAV